MPIMYQKQLYNLWMHPGLVAASTCLCTTLQSLLRLLFYLFLMRFRKGN